MGEQNLARGSHLPGLERKDKSQDSGGGRGGSGAGYSSCGGIWGYGCPRSSCSTLLSFQKWRNGEEVRGLAVCTGVEGNLENFSLSSLGGPNAKEAGQEVL